MSDVQVYLDAFPNWLKTLAPDVEEFAALLRSDTVPESSKQFIAGGINYLFKSLDLIPDGIENLGYIDDAFVLRIASVQVVNDGVKSGVVRRFAEEAKIVNDFLAEDYIRLEKYVHNLTRGAARGRTVDEILGDPRVRDSLLGDVTSWVAGYQIPTFHRDEKTLVKLRAFLDSKLPKA